MTSLDDLKKEWAEATRARKAVMAGTVAASVAAGGLLAAAMLCLAVAVPFLFFPAVLLAYPFIPKPPAYPLFPIVPKVEKKEDSR